MDGVLIVDKPAGPTSHDVVARARRALRTKRIGHTGTLDPLATGVLPLVVGRATRLAQFLTSDEKEYLATVRFGLSTATYDAERRQAVAASDGHVAVEVARAEIESALESFRGTYLQTPPPYSAKKIHGIPAYRLARSQKPVETTPVEVTVRTLELLASDGETAQLRLVSSSGFYVRTLAHELGQRLGCGAYLETLRRTRAGDFSLEHAVPLDAVETDPLAAAARLIPLERLLQALPAVVLNERGRKRAAHGHSLGREDLIPDLSPDSEQAGSPGPVRLLDASGALVGMAAWEPGGLLHPAVVLV